MTLEKQKQIEELMNVYQPNDSHDLRNARLLGMCQAMLTDEQADIMMSYIQKWIEEK